MNYYIADTHFGHANVIKHDGRPFDRVEEMDDFLIAAWNSRVTDGDDVYIIGDFVFGGGKSVTQYCNKLKGKKHLILGNHDKLTDEDRKQFASIDKLMHISDNGIQICACHYPMIEWNGFFRGHYHIFGHIHNNLNDTYYFMKNREKALNAGCMINNYMPVTFTELELNNRIFRENN